MSTRANRRKATNKTATVETHKIEVESSYTVPDSEPENHKPEDHKADTAFSEGPAVVKIVLISGYAQVHPCGTRCLPNDPVYLPDDNWTAAQEKAGLIKRVE